MARTMAQPLASVKTFPSLIFSWRSLAILFLLFNLKILPGMWTYRVMYQFITALRREKVQLRKEAAGKRPLRVIVQKVTTSDPISLHPLFTSETMTTHAPILELDYNIHKSNSTYFSDLDVSRSKLMGRLMAPVWPLDRVPLEIDPSKATIGTTISSSKPGRPSVILGAVHTSFKREIPAYTPYQVQSRLLTWDNRWIYIGTWFYTKSKTPNSNESKPILLASGLSKYILKRGRITVRPETIFRVAGWLPDIPSSPASSATQDSPDQTLQWTAEEIETERRRCLELLEKSGWNHMDGALESEFRL